jgi:hypothetical protein
MITLMPVIPKGKEQVSLQLPVELTHAIDVYRHKHMINAKVEAYRILLEHAVKVDPKPPKAKEAK